MNIDPKRRHMKDGEECERCGGKVVENHDNFECKGCSYVKWDAQEVPTGILVRAMHNGKWGTFDISELDFESLYAWVDGLESVDKTRLIQMLLGHPV